MQEGTIVGIVGIVAAIVLALFTVRKSKKAAKPRFYMSSTRLLGRHENMLPREVTVQFDGKNVDRLTKTTLVLWNDGSDVLDGKNVVDKDPIRVSLDAGESFLSYDVSKRTRGINEVCLKQDSEAPHKLLITFLYLDPRDGVTIETLHDSGRLYPMVEGSIMGIPKGFEDLTRRSGSRFYRRIAFSKYVRTASLFFPMGWGTGLIVSLVRSFLSEMRIEIGMVVTLAVGLFCIVVPGLMLWSRRRRYPSALGVKGVDDLMSLWR